MKISHVILIFILAFVAVHLFFALTWILYKLAIFLAFAFIIGLFFLVMGDLKRL